MDLSTLAAVVADVDAGKQAQGVANAIGAARSTTPAADLDCLRAFARSRHPEIANAAASRAYRCGDAGRELARRTLLRLAAEPDSRSKQGALSRALELGLEAREFCAAARELDKTRTWSARVSSLAILLRAGVVKPGDPQPGRNFAEMVDAISLARIAVDEKALRGVVAPAPAMLLPRLFRGVPSLETPPVTRVAALKIIKDLAVWPRHLEWSAMFSTSDPDWRVRHAAYSALATRTVGTCDGAWLIHEAALDIDRRVRKLAPQ